jgi:uncharacterized protein (TIGR02996 family)
MSRPSWRSIPVTDYRTHPEYRALLASVLAAPADDAPRLVLADWLDENGRPERAKLVRAGIAVATAKRPGCCDRVGNTFVTDPAPKIVPCDCEWADLYRSETEAWAAWDALGELPLPFDFLSRHPAGRYDSPCFFRRGFIESVTLPAEDWLAHADRILAEHPVTSVRLTAIPEVEYDGDRLRLAGDRWFGIDETAGESRRLARIVLPTLGTHGYWQHDAHILCRLRWPGIEFELPPSPQGGLPVPRHLVPAVEAMLAGTVTIGGQTYPISHWGGPHPVMDGDPVASLPMGVIDAESGDPMPPAAPAGPTRLIDGGWKELDPPNPMVRDEREIARRRKANKTARKARARNRR